MQIISSSSKLTAVTIAACALSAGASNAQSVQVVDELTSQHCPGVVENSTTHRVSGGCHYNAESLDVDLAGHIVGIEATALMNCAALLEFHFNEDGLGYVTGMEFDNGTGSSVGCSDVHSCNSASGETHAGTHGNGLGDHVWNLALIEPTSTPPLVASMQTCYITHQAINECEGALALNVTEVGANEDLLEAVANNASVPTNAPMSSTHCELTAHFDITDEPGEDIHVNHL